MTKKLRTTGTTQPRITVTGSTERRIDPAEVAAALGAEPIPGAVLSLDPDRTRIDECHNNDGNKQLHYQSAPQLTDTRRNNTDKQCQTVSHEHPKEMVE